MPHAVTPEVDAMLVLARRCLVLVAVVNVAASSLAMATGRLTPTQQQRLITLVKQAEHVEQGGDSLQAFLTLKEAERLEQLWSANTAGEDTVVARAVTRYTTALLRREDGALAKILHSRRVALGDKLGLIHVLEQDVLVNFPGRQTGGLLPQEE